MATTTRPTTRDEIIDYCAEVLKRRGHHVKVRVKCGIDDRLQADIVTRTTVYEIRQNLDELSLYAGTGQGLVYKRSLQRRKLVLVGYVPAAEKRGQAFYVAANIEHQNLARVSFLDLDPFWGITPTSYRWLGLAFAGVSIVAAIAFSIPLLREEIICRTSQYSVACASRNDRFFAPK